MPIDVHVVAVLDGDYRSIGVEDVGCQSRCA